MITVSVKSNVEAFRRGLSDIAQNQMPFAVAQALTETAKLVAGDMKAAMPSLFDRPTPYVQNAFISKGATKKKLVALVSIRNFGGKHSSEKILGAEVTGGDRNLKGFEVKFAASVPMLSAAQALLPANETPLDRFGNVNRNFLVNMLANMRPVDPNGRYAGTVHTARRAAGVRSVAFSKAGGYRFFVGNMRASGALAILQVVKRGQVRPVLFEDTKRPVYRARLPFAAMAQTGASKHFDAAMAKSFATAMRTARP